MLQQNIQDSLAALQNQVGSTIGFVGGPGNGQPLTMDSLNGMIQNAVNSAVTPLTKQVNELAPVVSQHNQQTQQIQKEQQKQGIFQTLDMLKQLATIASSILDKPRVEWLYNTFTNEVVEEFQRCGDFQTALRAVGLRHCMWFAQLPEGQEWLRNGIDAYKYLREVHSKPKTGVPT